MELVNLKNANVSSFSMERPEKVDEENKIYLAAVRGPMVYFKAHVYVSEDHEYSIVNEGYQHFVDTLTSHFQQVCSSQSEDWFKGKHFSLEFIQNCTESDYAVSDKVYDQNKRRVKKPDVASGDYEADVVSRFDGFYFKGSTITSMWNIVQIRINKEIEDEEYLETPEEVEEVEPEAEAESVEETLVEEETNFADFLE
jgi:hypothetical protein